MTTAQEALLSLAAEFEEMSRHRTLMENAAYRYAAAMARQRAAALPAEANPASPASREPGSGSGALRAAQRPAIPRLEAAPPGDWRDDLCTCEGRPQHIHCPWGGGHVHYVDDEGNDIHRPRLPEEAPDAP